MPLRTYRTFQAIILAGLGFFLLDKIWSGRLVLYINQRYVVLIMLAGLGLLALAQGVLNGRPMPTVKDTAVSGALDSTVAREKPEAAPAGSRFNLLLVIFPIILGLVIPARALGTSALPARGVSFSAVLSNSGAAVSSALDLQPGDRNILDWIRAFESAKDPAILAGQPVDVTGFVYHDPRLGKNQFMVGRFAITCCVADALALGMVVEWPDAAKMADNGWVRIRGSLKNITLEGSDIPLIQATTIEDTPEPEQPYLFP